MTEAKLSERAQKILTWLTSPPAPLHPVERGERFIRQQALAEEFGCSRRTIGRALKELKEAGLLIDLNRRHENRCKLYEVKSLTLNPSPASGEGLLTPEAQRQWELYEYTFRVIFKTPELPSLYAQVTRELGRIKNPDQLWRKTFDRLYEIQGMSCFV